MEPALGFALAQWRRVVGAANVITEPPALASAASATFATTQRLMALVYPGDRTQVQECVRIANQYRIPLYPVSTGKNWGYGSRVPPQDGCVLLGLHRMNRILELNEELGYVTVEPGVTQKQLHQYLREQKSGLIVPTTGSSPHTSILGNAVERGASAVGRDKNDCICALEVVLPNGECVHTGFGHFPNAKANNVYRWGVGPNLDGLFIQSSFGIVTRLTVWLMHRRATYALVIFFLQGSSSLTRLLGSIRRLLQSGGFPQECGGIHLVNSYKMLTYRRSYPWAETSGSTPLGRGVLPSLFSKDRRNVKWYGAAVVSMPNRALLKAYKRTLRATLRTSADAVYVFDNRLVSLLRFVNKTLPWLRADDVRAILETTQGPLFGIPKPGGNLRAVYWRKRFAPDSPEDYDPDRDHCGVIWLFIVLPFDPGRIDGVTQFIEETSFRFSFEPVIEIHAMSHRSALLGLGVFFDRDVPGEDSRAQQCHDYMFDFFVREGYYPYRLGIQHVGRLPASTDYCDRLLAALKVALDPHRIMAPGRYEVRPGEDGPLPRAVI